MQKSNQRNSQRHQTQFFEQLFLSHNSIENLPTDFFEGADKFLKTLDLRYNRLKTLPDAIIDFEFLKVYVAGNPDLKVSDELRNSGKLIFE